MAAGAIARVLANLIGKHGLARGIKMAQKLGFKNKEIQSAVSKMTKQLSKGPKSTSLGHQAARGIKKRDYRQMEDAYRQQGTFAQRKANRIEDMYLKDFMREQRKAQGKYASEHFDRFGQEVDDILW
jgi:hypothetical protein